MVSVHPALIAVLSAALSVLPALFIAMAYDWRAKFAVRIGVFAISFITLTASIFAIQLAITNF